MPLVPFAAVDRSALRWLRTGGAVPEFTLLAGEAPVAVLRWQRHRGARALAETADGSWTLGRSGFLVPHLTIRRSEAEPPVARVTNRLGHHEIEVGGKGAYRLRRAGLLVPAWALARADGTEVAHIEPVAEDRKLSGGAVLVDAPAGAAELLLLVVLSWYLIVLLWVEDETVEALVPFEGPDAPARLGGGSS